MDSGRVTVERERFRVCPKCGNFVGFSDSPVFCMVCGSRLIEECPSCREPIIYPLARFCPACGVRLVNADADDLTPGTSQGKHS